MTQRNGKVYCVLGLEESVLSEWHRFGDGHPDQCKVILTEVSICIPLIISDFCFCSLAKSCPSLGNPVACSMPHSSVHFLPVCSDSCPLSPWCYLTICHPLLLVPSVFSNLWASFHLLFHVHITQGNVQIQCNSYQITSGIFLRPRTKHFTICMERAPPPPPPTPMPNSRSSLEKEKWNWWNEAPWLQSILQSYSNHDTRTEIQIRSKERKPRDKPTHIWAFIFDRGGKNIQKRRQSLQ